MSVLLINRGPCNGKLYWRLGKPVWADYWHNRNGETVVLQMPTVTLEQLAKVKAPTSRI